MSLSAANLALGRGPTAPRKSSTLSPVLPAILIALALASSGAVAQSAPITLDAQLPGSLERCISTAQLQASYDRLQQSADPTDPPSTAPLRVELRSDAAASGDITRVELRAFRTDRLLGTRTLPIRGRDCAALPDTVALVVQVLTRSAPPEPSAPPPSAATPIAPPPAEPAFMEPEPAASPEPSTQAGTTWSVGLGGSAVWGMLSEPAFSPQLLAAVQLPILELRVQLSGLWPQEHAVEEGLVRMWTYEAGLDACEALHFEPWVLRVCLGPRFGLTRAKSRDFLVRKDLSEFSLYLAALPEIAFAIGRTTWIQLRGGIAIGLQRPKFVLEFESGIPPRELDGPRTLRAELGLAVMQSF